VLLPHSPVEELTRVPQGSCIIHHNGQVGVAGHFIATQAVPQQQVVQLGAPVLTARKKAKIVYDRHKFKDKWLVEYRWLRRISGTRLLGCYCCWRFPALRPKDLLGKGELAISKCRQDYFSNHENTTGHKAALRALTAQSGGKVVSPHQNLGEHISITPCKVIVCRMLTTLVTIVMEDMAFSKLKPLCAMQEQNGLPMGGGAYKNNTFWDDALFTMGQFYTFERDKKILVFIRRGGMWYSADGSTSISNVELEFSCIGYFDFDKHKAVFEPHSIDEIKYAASEDGGSPDASAIFETQMDTFTDRFGENAITEVVKDCSVAVSFDGASVMMGNSDSVATRWIAKAEQVVAVHAVAHRLESAWTDAAAQIMYMLFIGELSRDLYNFFNTSAKQSHAFQKMAELLETPIKTLKPLHGIRWLASQCRVIQAILVDYVVLVSH